MLHQIEGYILCDYHYTARKTFKAEAERERREKRDYNIQKFEIKYTFPNCFWVKISTINNVTIPSKRL